MAGCIAAAGEITGDCLAERMRKEEEWAFREFGRRYGPRFRMYFIKQGLPFTPAEDLAGTAVSEAALHIDRFRSQGPGSFDRWVFTLAYHLCLGWVRQHAKQVRELEAAAILVHVRSREPSGAAEAFVERLRAAVSEADWEILLLRSMSVPFTYAEIAKELGIAEGAARTRHHRALARLRALFPADAPAGEK